MEMPLVVVGFDLACNVGVDAVLQPHSADGVVAGLMTPRGIGPGQLGRWSGVGC
jgi:hypothetical protein